ncbi:MAG: ABC transporter family substrate-binding protein [Acidimicrobiales bacterium]
MIIVIIALVATVDHLGSNRISQVDAQTTTSLVPAKGGTATVELDRAWHGFNPNTPAGAASSTPMLLSSVLPSSYTVNPKLVPVVNSALLLSVEVLSTSPLTIQYVINPKAVWSDGVPVTAADFIYAWECQRGDGIDVNGQPDQVASTLGYRDVQSVTGSNAGRTVTVKFSKPFTDWRILFNNMVPAHIAKRVGWNTGFDTFDPSVELSAGPYLLRAVRPTGTAVLVRNPRWWGTPATLKEVTVNVAPDPSGWTSAIGHDNQAVAQPSVFGLRTLNTVTSLPNMQSQVTPSLNMLSLEFDVVSPLTSQVAVREAVAHLIDRSALINQTVGTIEPGVKPSQDHLSTASQSTYISSSAASSYLAPSPATANQLLRSSGYHQDPTGAYVDSAGTPLVLRMAVESGNPWTGQVAALIAQQLRSAGIGVVTFTVRGTAGLAAADASSSYDLALVMRTMGPYQTVTQGWYSFRLGPGGAPGSQNWSNFDDPEVDQLFAQAASDLNPVTGSAVYAEIDDQLWGQMVALPLFVTPSLLVTGVQISNVEANPSVDGVLWNLPLWATLEPGPPHSGS